VKVSQLAKMLNVAPDTVRFYTRIGFIRPNINEMNGYKEYGDKDLRRLRFVLCARHLGFTVKDIGNLLVQADGGKSSCSMVRELIQRRLEETEQQFEETLALRNRMKMAIEDWKYKPDMEPTGDMICHLIEGFPNELNEEKSSGYKKQE